MPNYTAPDVGPGAYPLNRVGAVTFHDVSARWSAPWNATVSVGVNDVFDKKLPVMYTSQLAVLHLRRLGYRSLLLPALLAEVLV
jgi:hypothetical protein